MTDTFWRWLAIEGPRVAPAIVGGVVISLTNWEGWRLSGRKILVGCAVAWALGPTAVVLFETLLRQFGLVEMPGNAHAAVHFTIGVVGLVLIETVVRIIGAYRLRDGS